MRDRLAGLEIHGSYDHRNQRKTGDHPLHEWKLYLERVLVLVGLLNELEVRLLLKGLADDGVNLHLAQRRLEDAGGHNGGSVESRAMRGRQHHGDVDRGACKLGIGIGRHGARVDIAGMGNDEREDLGLQAPRPRVL